MYEAKLNQYQKAITTIDGQTVHFLHVRSPETNATPLMLIHGWPGSVAEFLDVIEPLTNPSDHGGNSAGWTHGRIAKAFADLMARLGYRRYGVQGNIQEHSPRWGAGAPGGSYRIWYDGSEGRHRAAGHGAGGRALPKCGAL